MPLASAPNTNRHPASGGDRTDRRPPTAQAVATGDLHQLGGNVLHFCFGRHPTLGHVVRTVERNGREIARGRRPFDVSEWDDDEPDEPRPNT